MIGAGELNRRVTLQAVTRAPDGAGGYVETWIDLATIWSKVEALCGRELFLAQQVQAELSHRVTIRFRHKITPAMRLKYGIRILEIVAPINPDEGTELLQLMCKEIPA